MIALLEFTSNSDVSLYFWTTILIVAILAVAIPLTIYEQKLVKARWKIVSAFVQRHEGQIRIRPLHLKESQDILIPIFSGFLIHGHFTYICLDPLQDRPAALAFITELRSVCLANNSWHFDFFTNRVYMWHYYGKAIRAFAGS